MSELTRLTIAEARKKLLAKEISAVELTDAYLDAIDAANPQFNAYVTVTHDIAREQAKRSDAKIAAGKFVVSVDRSGRVVRSELERGGSVSELFRRWRR